MSADAAKPGVSNPPLAPTVTATGPAGTPVAGEKVNTMLSLNVYLDRE